MILRQRTIDIGSVLSLYTSALFRVSRQLTRVACPMSKMACCSTTSKIFISFLLIWSSKNHVHTFVNLLNVGFIRFFPLLPGMPIMKLESHLLLWYGKMKPVASMSSIQTAKEKFQLNNMYVCVLLFIILLTARLAILLTKRKEKRYIQYSMVLATVSYLIILLSLFLHVLSAGVGAARRWKDSYF